jgi:hypothetical protein
MVVGLSPAQIRSINRCLAGHLGIEFESNGGYLMALGGKAEGKQVDNHEL